VCDDGDPADSSLAKVRSHRVPEIRLSQLCVRSSCACECRKGLHGGEITPGSRFGSSLPGRRLIFVWIVTLLLPRAICTLDEGPLTQAGMQLPLPLQLKACEARVDHLTTEIGRLQAQLSALYRADTEVTRGGRDGVMEGGLSGRVRTANERPSATFAPSEISGDSLDVHRKRQKFGGTLQPSHTDSCIFALAGSLLLRQQRRGGRAIQGAVHCC
jgi:hypothetical protein